MKADKEVKTIRIKGRYQNILKVKIPTDQPGDIEEEWQLLKR